MLSKETGRTIGLNLSDLSAAEKITLLLETSSPLKTFEVLYPDSAFFQAEKKEEGEGLEVVESCLSTLCRVVDSYCGYGAEEEELFKVGFLSLLEAIKSWNSKETPPEKRTNLKGKVSQRVSYSLKREIAKIHGLGAATDFPLVCLYQECLREFKNKRGRAPTLKEIDQFIREKNEGKLALEYPGRDGRNKIEIIFGALNTHGLVEVEEEEFSFSPTLDQEPERSFLQEKIFEVLAGLSGLKRDFIILKYGLGGEPLSLGEIAERYGIRTERVESEIRRGVRQMRYHPKINRLRIFL